jgi:hypothetical protein
VDNYAVVTADASAITILLDSKDGCSAIAIPSRKVGVDLYFLSSR